MTMLCMVTDLRGPGGPLNRVARAMALLIARSCYTPITPEHVPGVANGLAGQLGRVATGKRIPEALRMVEKTAMAPRTTAFYEKLGN